MKHKALLAILAVVAGCAARPEDIQPAYVSEMAYHHWDCQQLATEQQNVATALMNASAQQNQARSNDVAGVILIGLPVSSLSGSNVAPQVANLKGQQEAIRKAMITKKCGPLATPGSVPAAPAKPRS